MLGRGAPSIGKWGRRIDANDTSVALTVNQRGTGDLLDLQDGGVSVFKVADGGAITIGGAIGVADDILLKLGTDGDGVLVNRSTILAADTVLASVLVGTVESQAIAANSLMIANATSNGDIALYTNKGGNSQMGLWLDGSSGDTALLAASGASVDSYIAGVKELDHAAGAFAFQVATAISGLSSLAAFAADGQTVTLVAKNAAGQTQTVMTMVGAATVANSYITAQVGGIWTLASGQVWQVPSHIIGAAVSYSIDGKRLELNTSNDYGGIALHTWVEIDAASKLDFNRSGSTTLGNYAAVPTGQRLGIITFQGADGTDWQPAVYLVTKATGTVGNNRVPGLMEFHAYSDAASSVDTTVLTMTAAGITWNTAVPHTGLAVVSAGQIEGLGTGANGFKLKNLKNAAATALSGTQLDVEIDIGGTPYYFTVYPTKA